MLATSRPEISLWLLSSRRSVRHIATLSRDCLTANGIAYDRAGPRGELPVVLIHAGVADRGMWDAIWAELTDERDAVRVDLRGFGDSAARPAGALAHREDVLSTLSELGVDRCHMVGASFGAGVAVEVALTEAVGGGVAAARRAGRIAARGADARTCGRSSTRSGAALERGDLDAAVEANLAWWVEGTRRSADQVDPLGP